MCLYDNMITSQVMMVWVTFASLSHFWLVTRLSEETKAFFSHYLSYAILLVSLCLRDHIPLLI